MKIESFTLAIRPAGSPTWIEVDPSTTRGRAVAAAFGFTTPPQKELSAMSAVPMDTRADLHIVQNNKEKMGLLLQAKVVSQQAWNYLSSAPKKAWAWVRSTLHLDAAKDFVAGGVVWLKHKVLAAARLAGTTGMIGSGLLTVSTDAGRKGLAFAGKPLVFAAKKIGQVWLWTESTLFTEEDATWFGQARNWVADRMADVRCFLFGCDGKDAKPGIVQRAFAKVLTVVGPYLGTGSSVMIGTRITGGALVAKTLFGLAALLPVAGGLIIAAKAAVVIITAIALYPSASTLANRGLSLVTPAKASGTKAAASNAGETVTQIPTTQGGNRAARRHQARKTSVATAGKTG